MSRKVIVTSGPTREWIDPVRYISNASTGSMGYSIAQSILKFKDKIGELVYIAGGTEPQFKQIHSAKNISVETTMDLLNAVLSEFQEGCILIMAAAPADYRPKYPSNQKIKKKDFAPNSGLAIEWEENPDILATVSESIRKENWSQIIRIGFSAETTDLEKNAMSKLVSKDLDWIIGNLVGRNQGFGQVESQLFCYSRDGKRFELGPASKEKLAESLVEYVLADLL